MLYIMPKMILTYKELLREIKAASSAKQARQVEDTKRVAIIEESKKSLMDKVGHLCPSAKKV